MSPRRFGSPSAFSFAARLALVCCQGLAVAGALALRQAHAQATVLDATFSPLIISSHVAPGPLAALPDGRIVAMGAVALNGQRVPQLIRLLPNGELDRAFNAPDSLPKFSNVQLRASSDGAIVLAGQKLAYGPTGIENHVVRLSPAGDLVFDVIRADAALDMLPTPDGGVLIMQSNRVVRLDSTGHVDPTFSGLFPAGTFDGRLGAIQPDGGIILNVWVPATTDGNTAYRTIRLKPNGALDTTFTPYTSSALGVSSLAMILRPNGKILVFNRDSTFVRLNSDGTVDASFTAPVLKSWRQDEYVGADGTVAFAEWLGDIFVLDSDDQLVARLTPPANTHYDLQGVLPGHRLLAIRRVPDSAGLLYQYRQAVVELKSDGSEDPAFVGVLGYAGAVTAMYPDSDNAVVVGGIFDSVNGQPRAGIARFRSDGTLDSQFAPTHRRTAKAVDVIRPNPSGHGYFVFEGDDKSYGHNDGYWTALNDDGTMASSQLDPLFSSQVYASWDSQAFFPQPEAGGTFLGTIATPGDPAVMYSYGVALARYTPGQKDPVLLPTKLPGGISPGPGEYSALFVHGYAVTPLQDGTFMLSGDFKSVNGQPYPGRVHLNHDGSIADSALAPSPPVFDDIQTHFQFQTQYPNGVPVSSVARLLNDGTVDPTFSVDRAFSGQAVATDAVGRVLFTTYGGALIRLWPNGAMDANLPRSILASTAMMTNDGTVYASANGLWYGDMALLQRWIPQETVGISHQPGDATVVAGRDVHFDAAVGVSRRGTYQWYRGDVAIPGATSATLTITAATARDAGSYHVIATLDGQSFTSTPAMLTVQPSDGRLANFSARVWTGQGDAQAILGFHLATSAPTAVLVRAIGPGLGMFGVANTAKNPSVTLSTMSGAVLVRNAGWGGGADLRTAFARFGAFGLPTDSADSAVATSLPAGAFSGAISASTPGVALGEVYADTSAGSVVRNASVRTAVGSGTHAATVGFVINGTGPRKLLFRAVGASLSTFGLRGLPGDLRVQVFTGGYAPQLVRDVATRDAAADAAASTAGAFPLTASTGDVATVLALEPGTYTAISTSQNEGIGLLELYDITD